MLRSVAEVSVLTGLSKVSIYNKIKLKEIEKYVDVSIGNTDFKEFKLELKELNSFYLTLLKSENEVLKKQLDEKDKQISELHKLIENSQILLKEEQKKSEQQLYLVEHFEEVDNKLQDLREKMEQKRNEK